MALAPVVLVLVREFAAARGEKRNPAARAAKKKAPTVARRGFRLGAWQ